MVSILDSITMNNQTYRDKIRHKPIPIRQLQIILGKMLVEKQENQILMQILMKKMESLI